MNERIENTYTRSGRIANPTEQGKMNERIENTYTRSGRIANPTEQDIILPTCYMCVGSFSYGKSHQFINSSIHQMPFWGI